MVNIIYNQETKTFSMKWGRLDEDDWERSFFQLLDQSEVANNSVKAFSDSDEVKFKSNVYVEIQYLIYAGFAYKRRWTYDYLPKSKAYDKMHEMCKGALSELGNKLKAFMLDINQSDYESYTKKKGDQRKYYYLDNYNRFVFKIDIPYNTISISSIMLHHTKKIERVGKFEFWMKKLLVQLVNEKLSEVDDIDSNEFEQFINKLRKEL